MLSSLASLLVLASLASLFLVLLVLLTVSLSLFTGERETPSLPSHVCGLLARMVALALDTGEGVVRLSAPLPREQEEIESVLKDAQEPYYVSVSHKGHLGSTARWLPSAVLPVEFVGTALDMRCI